MLKKIFIMTIIIMCLFVSFYSVAFADDIETTRRKVDNQIGKIVKLLGYSIIFVLGVKEIIQQARIGDIQGIGSVFVKYMLIYGALLGLPIGLRFVENFIEGLM